MNPMNSFTQMVNMLQTVQLTNLMVQAVLPSIMPASKSPSPEEPTIVAAGTVIDGKSIAANSTVVSGGRVFKAL